MLRLIEKGKLNIAKKKSILNNITIVESLESLRDSDLIIEAIVENSSVKKELFSNMESIVSKDCVLATNTSSISITSLASSLKNPFRFIGIHFFNPAPLMPLVEIIPSLSTSDEVVKEVKTVVDNWGKVSVLAKDTPGFIVNRVARPFYSEAIKMSEEGVADYATIDWALKELGGFRMGPFELMDLIGHDVNYIVTETVWSQFYYDPRFKPSITQKRLFEAGLFGRKSGRGFYDHREGAEKPSPLKDHDLGRMIVDRIVAMLINEAADASLLQIGSNEDIDLAMTKGVNYPKGLLRWADEIGIAEVFKRLENLQEEYGDDRYRPCVLLRRMAKSGESFYA